MRNREQSVIDADAPDLGSILARRRSHEQQRPGGPSLEDGVAGERAARRSLRGQIAKLERELSAIVAETFPHIAAPRTAVSTHPGPCLLGLEELERSRDRLAGRVHELRGSRPTAPSTSGGRAINWSA